MDFLSTSNFSSPLSVSEAGHTHNLSKRQKVVKEIFESEQKYLSQLQTIVDVFLKPIRVGGLLPPNAISIIFGNVEGILGVNTELLNYMQRKSLGDAFTYLAPFLKMYASYSSNYQMASELLERSIKRDQKFADFIEIQESRPECNYLNLPSLLITPVQRIPRYKLLLDELLRHTKHTHIEYSKISSAVQQIAAIASFINEYIRQHENAKKMIEIQASLSGATVPGIIVPGRKFIKEGRLMKICRRRPKERMVFLFSDMLMYARTNILDTRSFICRGVLPLVDAQIQVLLNDERVPDVSGLIQLTTSDNNVISLYSTREEETFQWADEIQATIFELQNDILSPVKPTKYHHQNHFTSFDEQSTEYSTSRGPLESLAFPPSASPIGGQMPMIIETPSSPISPSIPPPLHSSFVLPNITSSHEDTVTPLHVTPVTITSVVISSPIPSSTVATNTVLTSSPLITATTVPTVVSTPLPAPIDLVATEQTAGPTTSTSGQPQRVTEMEIEDTPISEQERIPLLPTSSPSNETRGSKCCIIS